MNTWKEYDRSVLTHSAAHHLMAIDELLGRLGYARVSDIARQLGITRGSVSISLRPLKEGRLVLQDENRHLRLSERGQALVAAIKTKRHLMRRLLAEVLGVAPEQAEIDACKLEHLLSNESAQRVLAFLRYLDASRAAGQDLVEAWRAFDAHCGREPASCPSCEDECLAEKVSRDRGEGAGQ